MVSDADLRDAAAKLDGTVKTSTAAAALLDRLV